uniref:Zinc finger NFX1-type containing 1 n=1 Tax=Myripristis murdjan TaxID=586833 RepID=A0A667YEL4_9TELE
MLPFPDNDTGRNENANRGRRGGRGRGAQGNRVENRGNDSVAECQGVGEGRRWPQSNGRGQGQREDIDGGEGTGGRGRGRGRGRGKGAGGVDPGGDGGRRGGRGGGRGGRGRGEGAERGRGAIRGRGGRNGEQGIPERGGVRGGRGAERRGGQHMERFGGRGAERRDGSAGELNTGRSNSTGGGGHRLGYKALEELSGKDPSEVAITLSTNPALPGLLDERAMRQDLVQLLCLTLSNAFKSQRDRGTLQHLASIIKDSGFLRTILPHYLVGMGSEFRPDRREQYPQHLDNILALLSNVLNIFPASSVQAVSMLVTLLQASINILRALGVGIEPQTEEKVENLQGLINHLQERSREGTLRSDKDKYALLPTDGEHQQNFRNLPIYPTPEELHQDQKPILRPNLISQRYTNTHIYLDTHFRLLREDFVQPLREGIQQLLSSHLNMGRNDTPLKRKRFDDIRVYFDTRLMVPQCTNAGLAYTVQFDSKPLEFVRWQNSKRLLYGSLVCLSCDNFESTLFATVSDRDPNDLQRGQVQIIFSEESRVKLARIEVGQYTSFLMVETTAYFEAYRYVLEGLQEHDEADVPFQRYIVECSPDVRPPAYLARGDTCDLSSIADPEYKHSIKPFHSLKPEAWPRMEELGLDESQMRALQMALTKELAIIQGPPGTGKTYVGLKIAQALLTNEHLWSNGTPVLVVCYTNHALDQFLEGMHQCQLKDIQRVGGRSNSDILKRFTLRELTQSHGFRRSLPGHLRFACSEIESHGKRLECSLKGVLRETFLQKFISEMHWISLHSPPSLDDLMTFAKKKSSVMMEWLALDCVFQQRETEDANPDEGKAFMWWYEPMEVEEEDLLEIAEEADLIQAERMIEDNYHHRDEERKRDMRKAIREVEELMLAMNLEKTVIQAEQSNEEFQMQRVQKKRMKKKIRKELSQSSAMTETEERTILDVWTLNLQDRWRLYRLSVHQVIGMTTTGAAKYRKALQEVQPRLVIVEEAAEVLEAHTITTLSHACQHLILIGDHQQLRPSATVYELAKNFNLEVSMFERLVKMQFPYVRLNYQHRMAPEIARLLTPHIYSELENHSSVMNYDNIKGLNTNLFFVEHNYPEEEIKDGRSHQNRHEAMFVVSLCRYLVLQDYKPEQITILTTYTGQLHCLRKLMPASRFSGVKVHVVDKYQGEENDIVLLSLVRSNKQGKVGFLNIPNRVCVALSRAKKGLYCIGNSAMLGQVKLWSNIFHTLREKGQIGTALTLSCQNHPDRQIKVSCAEDFNQAPEGGCKQPCEFRLDCGHVCTSVCHPYDPEHKKYKCGKKCQRTLCDLGHKCTFVCHKPCPKECPVMVEKIIPKCQHKQMVPCHKDPQMFVCQEPCQKILPCGHQCDSVCGAPCTSMCKVKVMLKLSCGHSQQDACYYKEMGQEPDCRTPCNQQLKCGHSCTGNCHHCYQGCYHEPCFHKCERLLICSHKCREPCTRDCPPCRMPCENRCVHSKCTKPCGQPCAACAEPCAWQCPHQSCSKLCHEPCDRPPCNQPCGKILPCNHPCIGLCGEECPSKCRLCDHDEITEIFFGTEDDPMAHFIQLRDCGHIFEVTGMDHYMGMDENQQGNEEEQVAIKLKECPRCRTPIRKNTRYGSHINRSLAAIDKVKEKINGPQTDIAQKTADLKKQWRENEGMSTVMKDEYMQISNRLTASYLTANDLWILENKMALLMKVEKLLQIQMKQMSVMQGISFQEKVERFLKWLMNPQQKFTDQQGSDLERELVRLSFLAELNARCEMAEKRGLGLKVHLEIRFIRKFLEKLGQFTEQDEHLVKQALKDLEDKLPRTGLGISDEERKMIVSAFKMPPGHWYKCANGHVYLITECGGAMVSRRCPDCNATIGGESHALAAGNQVATEMDGSQHPAWSEANNILNFEQLDL